MDPSQEKHESRQKFNEVLSHNLVGKLRPVFHSRNIVWTGSFPSIDMTVSCQFQEESETQNIRFLLPVSVFSESILFLPCRVRVKIF